jgi:hypothetical protein
MSDRTTYRLLLEVPPGPVPEAVRLRRLLKALLRRYGLRCLAVEEVEAHVRRLGEGEGQDAGTVVSGVQRQGPGPLLVETPAAPAGRSP